MRCWLKNGSSLRDRCIDIDHAISMTYPVDCNINDINDKKKNNKTSTITWTASPSTAT